MNENLIEECVNALVKHYRTEHERRRQPSATIADQYDAGFCAGILDSINALDDLVKAQKL